VLAFNGGADLLDGAGVTEAVEDDVVAGSRKGAGDALANAAGRSGDDGGAGHGERSLCAGALSRRAGQEASADRVTAGGGRFSRG
jgi:hypothetical protein